MIKLNVKWRVPMNSKMKFGKCLKLIITNLDISINRLSKAINVDTSLVNRWVNEKRIPAYNSNYIESISEYISNNLHNSFHNQQIEAIYNNICTNSEPVISIKDKIYRILKEAQGYSFECKKHDKKSEEKAAKSLKMCTPVISESQPLSNKDKIILGKNNVFNFGIYLLGVASIKSFKDDDTIYITYFNDLEFTESYDNLVSFKNALLSAISNGWNILFLLKLNNNLNTIFRYIDIARELFGTGKFNTYFFRKYDTLEKGKELIIVPGIGALSCFSTNIHSGIDSAFYLESITAIDIHKNYFKSLLLNYAKPLIKYYTPDNYLDYCEYLAEVEEKAGNRFVYNFRFSMLLLPEDLYIKLIKEKNLSNFEITKSLYFYRKQLNAFYKNIIDYKYEDIYSIESLKLLVNYNQFRIYTLAGIETTKMEAEDIIKFLNNIIHLLETYENYNVAFVSEKPNSSVKINNLYCHVKERQSVFFEVVKSSKIPEVRLSIEEPMVVKACEEYFSDIWARIAPIYKDKSEVISWIHNQINLLKKQCC